MLLHKKEEEEDVDNYIITFNKCQTTCMWTNGRNALYSHIIFYINKVLFVAFSSDFYVLFFN